MDLHALCPLKVALVVYLGFLVKLQTLAVQVSLALFLVLVPFSSYYVLFSCLDMDIFA